MVSWDSVNPENPPHGYLGTRKIRKQKRLAVPLLMQQKEALDEAVTEGAVLHWGILSDEVPAFVLDDSLTLRSWSSLDEESEVSDAEFSVPGQFFDDFTGQGTQQLPEPLRPTPVTEDARLEVGQRVHFIRFQRQDLTDSEPPPRSPSDQESQTAVYVLNTWEDLVELNPQQFKYLFPTHEQLSRFLDNLDYEDSLNHVSAILNNLTEVVELDEEDVYI